MPPQTLAERAASLADRIEAELTDRFPGLLRHHPVEPYAALYAEVPPFAPYHAVPPAAETACQEIATICGAEALETYHRLTLARLIAAGVPESEVRLTDEARRLRDAYLERVLADLAKPRKGFYRHGHDQFAKDFATCRGRLIPCGVEVLDPRGGLPRSLAIKYGPRQAARFLGLLTRLGGFRTIWGVHFDRRLVREFNAEGYAALYLRLADLLELNPEIRGVSSWSWWHDPALAEISPELAFIGQHPESAGAVLLRAGENDTATADALRFAPRRIALHREGKYRPTVHMLTWPRKDLLAWAKAYRANQDLQANYDLQDSAPLAE